MWMRVIIRGILMMNCFLGGPRGRSLFVIRRVGGDGRFWEIGCGGKGHERGSEVVC